MGRPGGWPELPRHLLPQPPASGALQERDGVLVVHVTGFVHVAVDDASTDQTPSILNQRARGDRRLRVLSTVQGSEQGIVAALNLGIAAARGRYIARMDADDIAVPDATDLERAVALLDTLEGWTTIGEEPVPGCFICMMWVKLVVDNAAGANVQIGTPGVR